MKKINILFISLILFSISIAVGQNRIVPYDNDSKKFIYTDIVTTGKAKKEDYNNAKNWILTKYSNTVDEVENERILSKGSFEIILNYKAGIIPVIEKHTINFNILLEFREGRYRYSLYDIIISQNAEGTTGEMTLETYDEIGQSRRLSRKFNVRMQTRLHEEFNLLIKEMISKINGENDKKDDW